MKILEEFKVYLQKRGYAPASVKHYGQSIGYFLAWTQKQAIIPAEVSYKDLLLFLQYCQRQGQSRGKQRGHTTALRHLFRMLRRQHKRWGITMHHNPAEGLLIRTAPRRLPHDLLDMKDLKQIYEAYPDDKLRKLLLSMVIFQAVRREELAKLRVHHLHLKAGKITVPATTSSNQRVLPLALEQMMPLYEWVKHKSSEGRLFLSPQGSENLGNTIQVLIKQVRKIQPEAKDLQQIRASVIAHWLKSHDVRIVQYMAGHKWVSSTERYQQTDLRDLQNKLDKHHPLQ